MNGIVASEPAGMVDATLQLGFNYADLDLETRIVVQQRTEEIRVLARRTAQDIIDIGAKLIDVKARLGYGYFGRWLGAEFGWTDRTARQMMAVTERFNSEKFSVLDFAPSALYMLAAPSTPEPARLEAVARASTGETITHAIAKEIVAEHKPAAPRTVNPPSVASTTSQVNGPALPAWVEDDEPDIDDGSNYATIIDQWGSQETVHLQSGVTLEVAPAVAPAMAVHFSSETPEHYTPDEIITAVVACMGGIDLDPCSNSHEAPNVPAALHYTRADDGLAQPWQGCVYMNPPYGREIDPWIAKLVSEYETGAVSEAIALVPARTDTQWWQRLRNYHICFVTGRLSFKGAGNNESAPFPSAVVYLGNETDRFVSAFEGIGDIWHRTRHGYCFGE